jgi:RNA polymerase sigma-70 factor, ECF subfamily
LTDEELNRTLIRGLAGDTAAYREFLSALANRLRLYLQRRLGRMPQEVEDLVQELLLTIHIQRHTYRPHQPLTPWVYAIARYKLIDFLRRRSRSPGSDDILWDEAELAADKCDEREAEASFDIAKLLQTLPDKQRLPILYVKIEGNSVRDTAHRTGMSESAVRVGIHRGLKALAGKIRSSHEDG